MKAGAIEFLRTVGIFSLLDRSEIPSVLTRLAQRELAEGELLFGEGEPGRELYIIRTGGVRVTIRLPDGAEHEVARMGPGDFFGEGSLEADRVHGPQPRRESGRLLRKLPRDRTSHPGQISSRRFDPGDEKLTPPEWNPFRPDDDPPGRSRQPLQRGLRGAVGHHAVAHLPRRARRDADGG